ncbi:MAG: hypothetical protein AAF193_08905, partial [Bacteroidota bacterium]
MKAVFSSFLFFCALCFGTQAFSQDLDTLQLKSQMNGTWELEYCIYSSGEKEPLRFGPADNDSSLLIQQLTFQDGEVLITEWLKLIPESKYVVESTCFFYEFDGVFGVDID